MSAAITEPSVTDHVRIVERLLHDAHDIVTVAPSDLGALIQAIEEGR